MIDRVHIAEETEGLEQNLMGIAIEANRSDNLEDDIPDTQNDDLVIWRCTAIFVELSRDDRSDERCENCRRRDWVGYSCKSSR